MVACVHRGEKATASRVERICMQLSVSHIYRHKMRVGANSHSVMKNMRKQYKYRYYCYCYCYCYGYYYYYYYSYCHHHHHHHDYYYYYYWCSCYTWSSLSVWGVGSRVWEFGVA